MNASNDPSEKAAANADNTTRARQPRTARRPTARRRGRAMVAVAFAAGIGLVLFPQLAGAATTFNATLGSPSTVYPSSTGTQTNRVTRDGTVSKCGAPKGYPGTTTVSGALRYDAYQITNPTTGCLAVSFSNNGTGSNLFAVAYLNSFNPANVAVNYRADPGSSPSPGNTLLFSFDLAPGATAVLVVHEVNPGSAVGQPYSVTVGGTTTVSSNFVVTSTADNGTGGCTAQGVGDGCTLREALIDAQTTVNPNTPDTISFNIAGGPAVKTIVPTRRLPDIPEAVVIDGYTQPGAAPATASAPATILIELNGNNLDGPGLRLTTSPDTVSRGSTVRGLAINRFQQEGIRVDTVGSGTPLLGGHTITGCYIGIDPGGATGAANGADGIEVAVNDGNVIGGASPAERNVISANAGNGIYLVVAKNNTVQGNYIGTNAAGSAALANLGSGVLTESSSANAIGGESAAAGNLISGNGGFGIALGVNSSANIVQGNLIGTDAAGNAARPNGAGGVRISSSIDNRIGGTAAGAGNVVSGHAGRAGIEIEAGGTGNLIQGNFLGTDRSGAVDLGNAYGVRLNESNNTVGGSAAGAGNTIAYNDLAGVAVAAGTGNQIFGNSIFNNDGLGIDLIGPAAGVTPNDAGDADVGPNNLQNFPVITRAVSSGGQTTVEGTLDSVEGSFYIDVYSSPAADPSGFGEGREYLGELLIANDRGPATFALTVAGDRAGQFITATATRVGAGDTSEFSQAVGIPVPPPTPPPATPTPTPEPSASPTPPPTAQPLNISTRLSVQTGANVLIGGFIITGEEPKKVILRAIAPSLGESVAGVLADPIIELRGSNGELIFENDNWRDTQQSEIEGSGVPPGNDLESAIVATLAPGAYTGIVRGKDDSTGVAVVEVYDLDQAVRAQLANISTRGFVDTGDNVMIGGFILGGGSDRQIAFRGVGPSLADQGIEDVLEDPVLDLYNADGARLFLNDDWLENPEHAAQLTASGLALSNNVEAGIYTTLPTGAFTAVLSGKDGVTGVGVIEIYSIQTAPSGVR